MSLPAGPMISLTVALEGVYELWPREGEPRRAARHRFRYRPARQRARAGRAAARDTSAGKRAAQTPRLPPRLAHASRSLLGAADRDVRIERSAADGHRRDDSPGTNPPRRKAARARSCAPRSMPRFRPSFTSTTCTVLRHIAATSPITSPRKSARSSSLHEPDGQR